MSIVLLWLLLSACESTDTPLTRSEKVWIDSVYKEQARMLRTLEDSICIVQRDTIFKQYFDSILQKRIYEREKIVHKMEQNL